MVPRLLALIALVMLLPAPSLAFELSLDEDLTAPIKLPANQTVTVTLHANNDGVGASDPATVCNAGLGDEVCAWDVRVTTTGTSTFPPDPVDPMGNDVVSNRVTETEVLANGGNPLTGERGTNALFSFDVQTGDDGEVHAEADWVDAGLNLQQVGVVILATVEPDGDGDGVPDEFDACPSFANAMPLQSTSGSGIYDDCLCGDANGDGLLTGLDARRIQQCAAEIRTDCDPNVADATGDGILTGLDARRAQQAAAEIRQAWELKCPNRPEGVEPPVFGPACDVPGVTCVP